MKNTIHDHVYCAALLCLHLCINNMFIFYHAQTPARSICKGTGARAAFTASRVNGVDSDDQEQIGVPVMLQFGSSSSKIDFRSSSGVGSSNASRNSDARVRAAFLQAPFAGRSKIEFQDTCVSALCFCSHTN
jgi:hypothetical protein